jgi:hypothetical protein
LIPEIAMMLAGHASRTWQGYLRLSIRGLLALVLLIGSGFFWLVRSARIQHDAVAAIEKAGGYVRYDWQWKNGGPKKNGRPWYPGWLAERVGIDYLSHVVSVTFVGGLSDARLALLRDLNRLEGVGIHYAPAIDPWPVTDAGLVHLKGLSRLRSLPLDHSDVTDAGLRHLKGLTKLVRLSLDDTQVTDAGLVHLKNLTGLDHLSLNDTQVTDAGLAHLSSMRKLKCLHLQGTAVTDAGLAYLKGLSSLQLLSLDGTEFSDMGLGELQKALPQARIFHSIDAASYRVQRVRRGRIAVRQPSPRPDREHHWP